MNTGRVNISLVAILLALGGCSTFQPLGHEPGQPILSAADGRSMISVEVRELEPLRVDEAVAANSGLVR